MRCVGEQHTEVVSTAGEPRPQSRDRVSRKDATMATIGKVTKLKNGSFTGFVKTSEMKREVFITIIPIEGDRPSEKHPAYRVMIGDNEAGAAWIKTSKKTGAEYVTVTFEEPVFGKNKLCQLRASPRRPAREVAVGMADGVPFDADPSLGSRAVQDVGRALETGHQVTARSLE